jgi:hypothetical protein
VARTPISSHNEEMMVLLEAAFVLGLAALSYYLIIHLLTHPAEGQADPRPATRTGRWLAVHYDVDGVTRVVLEKVSPADATLVDEHLVSEIPIDDPEYDNKFLAAMAAARERRALFEAEDE